MSRDGISYDDLLDHDRFDLLDLDHDLFDHHHYDHLDLRGLLDLLLHCLIS